MPAEPLMYWSDGVSTKSTRLDRGRPVARPTSAAAAPRAAFSVAASGLTVTLTDQTTGGAEWWLWAFGDGGYAEGPNPVHTFPLPGLYGVALAAGNAAGATVAAAAVTVTASPPPPPPPPPGTPALVFSAPANSQYAFLFPTLW